MSENKGHRTLSCCCIPSTVLLIDDKITFLENMSLNLDTQLIYKLFDKPLEALRYLKEDYHPSSIVNTWLSIFEDFEDDADLTHQLINVDIASIHKIIYAPCRFRRISTVLVDYAMPCMNGLDFCRQLSETKIKKALVTGEADFRTAVNAFNEGVIDKFIVKDTPDFFEQINSTIHELQHCYYQDLTSIVIRNLATNPNSCFCDKTFIDFFYQLTHQHAVAEFYLVDKFGSFLFLDFEGNISWFIVKSEKDLEDYYDIALENDAPASVINALRCRGKVPFFFTESDQEEPVNNWGRFLHPAHKLEGKNTYYYSYIEGKSVYDIDTSKITSQKDYLEKLQSGDYN